MSGWASNSKYPFFSAMRASAQMISYEVSIGFVLVCVVLFAGTFNLSGIVTAQQGFGLGVINAYVVHPLLFPMWVVFFISSLAETARAPFDLTEAESELVAGLPDRIFVDELRAVLARQKYANILLMCLIEHAIVLGRMAAADRLGTALLCAGDHLVPAEDLRVLPDVFKLDLGDSPTLPL